jgi:hypothetical protein
VDDVSGPAGKVIRFLVTHAQCTECGAHYRTEDVYVLEQAGIHIWDLAAVCHQCYTLSIVRAVVRPNTRPVAAGDIVAPPPSGRAAPPEMVWSELTPGEEARFELTEPLSADDVLDACAFLSTFDGDFRALFGQEPDGS